MRSIKKIIALAMACVMVLALAAGCASNSDGSSGSGQDYLIRGSTTTIDAYFMAGFSNNASNVGIRNLINGYPTVAWTKDQGYQIDKQVVKEFKRTENPDGTVTFTFDLATDLVWNDGTPITAKDYVFGTLLVYSPYFEALDATNVGYDTFVGGNAYGRGYAWEDDTIDADDETVSGRPLNASGQPMEEVWDENHENLIGGVPVNKFTGLRLLGDYSFSITALPKEFPNYYEIGLYIVQPYPMAVIAPGCDVRDDGDGCYMTSPWSLELLRETMMDPKTGYAFNPKVTCGPYKFERFSPDDNSCVIVANDKYKGDYDGAKPKINKLIFVKTVSATQMQELELGRVHLIDGLTSGANIEAALDLVDAGIINAVDYPRAGYGKISLSCDFGPTQFVEVRQAIAYCLDREEFCRAFTKGHGVLTHSYYGLAQAEYLAKKEKLQDLNQYSYNVEKAKEVLDAGGWNLDANGNVYSDGVRYKRMDDGSLMALEIQWASSEDNPVSELIADMLPNEAMKAGIKIVQSIMDFDILLGYLYRETEYAEPTYHMFNLATNFGKMNYVWYYFETSPAYFGQYNTTRIVDDTLLRTARAMKNVPADDFDQWCDLWYDLIVRWNEILPEIPLYSNQYYDAFNKNLVNYSTSPIWEWHYAILRANMK